MHTEYFTIVWAYPAHVMCSDYSPQSCMVNIVDMRWEDQDTGTNAMLKELNSLAGKMLVIVTRS